jgi:2-C-methyl-D-erythritol 2,4-cyclodiphosphate synthase
MRDPKNMRAFRVGFGYDVHPLQEGARFVLGGVFIPYHKGPAGHSDADVLTHAIIDALLGACGAGDIGHQFPDDDITFKGADSIDLLKQTMQIIHDKGYCLGNLDATVCLQEPKISTYIPQMLRTLADALQTDSHQLSIKATTTEKLGFIGAGLGVSAYAVVLVEACKKSVTPTVPGK